MKASELKTKSMTDLQAELRDLLKEQFNLRMQKGTGQLNKTHLIKEVRHNIARVETVMSELKSEASS